MKTINIMKQLIAKHFDSKDEFVKELNNLCDIVEQEQENDREMRQIKNVARALLVKGVINITTENAIICEFYRQNNQSQPFETEIAEMSETVEVNTCDIT